MMAWMTNSRPGKKAKAMTRVDTGTWCAGSSSIGCAIETEPSSGLTPGMKNTQAQFLSETFSASGTEAIVARDGND